MTVSGGVGDGSVAGMEHWGYGAPPGCIRTCSGACMSVAMINIRMSLLLRREMQHRQELREKVLARAAARAEATSRRFTARGASGSIASAGAGREGEDEEVGVQLGAQGSSYRRPVVYGTQRYHQLWEMAKEVPERPEAEDGAVAQGELEGEASDAAWGATAVSEERRGEVRGGVRRRGTGTGLQEEDSVRSVPVHAMAGEGDELDGLD